jgi:hypothetical protein
MYPATYDWGTIEGHNFERDSLATMKKTCQQHCFSTIAYCYNDARVIKVVWTNLVINKMKGGAQSLRTGGSQRKQMQRSFQLVSELNQGVSPAESRETRKVVIGCVQYATVFDS